jgi:type II secretory pathway pseudopilin PulG
MSASDQRRRAFTPAGRLPARRRPRSAALTLVEVLVAVTLLGLLMTAVLSSYVFLLRGQQSLAHYTTMNADARDLLEILSRDLKSAVGVTDFTPTRLTLVVPQDTAGATAEVTYDYDPIGGVFTREAGGAARPLATGVVALGFTYLNGNNVVTPSLVELKQVQLTLRLERSVALALTSQHVISAQYTLRAKRTTH